MTPSRSIALIVAILAAGCLDASTSDGDAPPSSGRAGSTQPFLSPPTPATLTPTVGATAFAPPDPACAALSLKSKHAVLHDDTAPRANLTIWLVNEGTAPVVVQRLRPGVTMTFYANATTPARPAPATEASDLVTLEPGEFDVFIGLYPSTWPATAPPLEASARYAADGPGACAVELTNASRHVADEYDLGVRGLADEVNATGNLTLGVSDGIRVRLVGLREEEVFLPGQKKVVEYDENGTRAERPFEGRTFSGHLEGDARARASVLIASGGVYGSVEAGTPEGRWTWKWGPVDGAASDEGSVVREKVTVFRTAWYDGSLFSVS